MQSKSYLSNQLFSDAILQKLLWINLKIHRNKHQVLLIQDSSDISAIGNIVWRRSGIVVIVHWTSDTGVDGPRPGLGHHVVY